MNALDLLQDEGFSAPLAVEPGSAGPRERPQAMNTSWSCMRGVYSMYTDQAGAVRSAGPGHTSMTELIPQWLTKASVLL